MSVVRNAAAIIIWLVFAAPQTMSQPAAGVAPEAYMDYDAYWPPDARPIPVCWIAPHPTLENFRQKVREVVRQHIENQSGLRFAENWNTCATSSQGIRITVSSSAWPVSEVGRQYARDAQGRKLRQFGAVGNFIIRPTNMTLNFSLDQMAGFENCQGRNEHCIAVVAVHEFLHAIGFLHEHLRREAAQREPQCSDAQNPPADFPGYHPLPVGDYDRHSIMNYCNNIYSGTLELSLGDIAALRHWYPQ